MAAKSARRRINRERRFGTLPLSATVGEHVSTAGPAPDYVEDLPPASEAAMHVFRRWAQQPTIEFIRSA
jgi:hypothetical protein